MDLPKNMEKITKISFVFTILAKFGETNIR
jgi:hypothetical protein